MDYAPPNVTMNINSYKHVVPIGNRQSMQILKDLGVNPEPFPFDYAIIEPLAVAEYIQSYKDSIPVFDLLANTPHINMQSFLHKSFHRLYECLGGSEPILFVYIDELTTDSEEIYKGLLFLEETLKAQYPSLPFHILAIHKNVVCENTPYLYNYTITMKDELAADPINESTQLLYSVTCKQYLKQILFTDANGARLTLITPCTRPHLLQLVHKYIQFDKVKMWYIYYDGSKGQNYQYQFLNHPQIIEKITTTPCPGGNVGRNKGIEQVQDGLVYFIDDDNIIHPKFWNYLNFFAEDSIYTWNQVVKDYDGIIRRRLGNRVLTGRIDLAQYIVPRALIGDIRFKEGVRASDGKFIMDLYKIHNKVYKHLDIDLCFHNFITEIAKN